MEPKAAQKAVTMEERLAQFIKTLRDDDCNIRTDSDTLMESHSWGKDFAAHLLAVLTEPKDYGPATHKHLKRGTSYHFLGLAMMQSDMWHTMSVGGVPVDGRDVAVYRDVETGALAVRVKEEFFDGRFEELPHVPVTVQVSRVEYTIRVLTNLARVAWELCDNTEGTPFKDSDGIMTYTVPTEDWDRLSAALDDLDELPDDNPGYIMGPAAKAQWSLRDIPISIRYHEEMVNFAFYEGRMDTNPDPAEGWKDSKSRRRLLHFIEAQKQNV